MSASPLLSVRFSDPLLAAIKRVAAAEGLNVSQWLRKLAYEEIARAEGRCPCCGQVRLGGDTAWRDENPA